VAPARQLRADPPPLPGRRAQADRSSLGGLRRRAPSPAPPTGPVPPAGAVPLPGTSGLPAEADPPVPAEAIPAGVTPPGRLPGAGASGSGPTRDDLTKLWADQVLPGLPGRVKAYLSAGRFVDVAGGVATFAVPDPGLLARALPLRAEVEAALGSAAGVPVSLELVAEADPTWGRADPDGGRPARSGGGEADEDPEVYDLDELEDAGAAVVSPEQRLLEAFPGAEEVTP